jgi:hypothetical protein
MFACSSGVATPMSSYSLSPEVSESSSIRSVTLRISSRREDGACAEKRKGTAILLCCKSWRLDLERAQTGDVSGCRKQWRL